MKTIIKTCVLVALALGLGSCCGAPSKSCKECNDCKECPEVAGCSKSECFKGDKECKRDCKEGKCCKEGKKCKGGCKKMNCMHGGECRKLPVGVQLYSVRTDLEADFYGTLKKVREMGYQGVEFYGEYYGNDVVTVKRWCTELGLIPFSNHVPFQQMLDNVDKVIADNTVLGVQYIVFPYMDEASRPGVNPEQFAKTVAALGTIGAKVKAAGFQLLYHNHDFEFVNLPDGTVGYYKLFDTNDPSNLQCEVDVCWADYAGYKPAELLAKYAGRIPVVHLKDYYLEGKLNSAPYALIGISTDNAMKDEGGWFEYRPLGKGQVDIPAVIKAAVDGRTQWLCVEQDEPDAESCSRLNGIKTSAEYLRKIGLL